MIELQINFHDFVKAADAIGGPMTVTFHTTGVYLTARHKSALIYKANSAIFSGEYIVALESQNKLRLLLSRLIKTRNELEDKPDILTVLLSRHDTTPRDIQFTFGYVLAARLGYECIP